MDYMKEILQTPSKQSAVSSDEKPFWASSIVPQRNSNIFSAFLGWGHSTESERILGKCETDMERIAMKKESDLQEDKNVMKGWIRQVEEQDEEFFLEAELEAYLIERRRLYKLKHESDLTEIPKVVDQEKIQSSVHPNESAISKSHESLCLTEEIIKQITASKIRLQSEREGEKKQTLSAEELFQIERSLEKQRTEFSKVQKHRYKTWKEENSTENRAAVLFHFTKIENELNHFEKRTIQKYLENEEVDDTEKGEKYQLKIEKMWKKCDKNLEYHRRNQQKSIEEAMTVSENFYSILSSDEEFTVKKQKLFTNLVLILFLMFSALNSTRELYGSGEQLRKEQVCAFEKFYPGVVDQIFSLLIGLEGYETCLSYLSKQLLMSWLSTFRSQLVEFLPDGLDEFDFCN